MKYNHAQIRAMANRLLKAKNNGDSRYSTFVFNLSIRTGVSPSEIEQKILIFSKA